MLVNFTVGNYRSFKEQHTLSMEAANIKEFSDAVIEKKGIQILPIAALYGANSSGKSNILKAFSVFLSMLRFSNSMNSTDVIDVVPFLLDDKENVFETPSYFEAEILTEIGNYYRYGFEVNSKAVLSEWLYKKTQKKETCLFLRDHDNIGITKSFPEGKGLEIKTRNNALFLSVCDSFNSSVAHEIMKEIGRFIVMSAAEHEKFYDLMNPIFHQHSQTHSKILNDIGIVMNNMDLGFTRFEVPQEEEVAKAVKAFTFHNRYNDNGEVVGEARLRMKQDESEGTNKLFDILSAIVAVLETGGVLIVDELDCKLHPILTAYIIKMFNDPKLNTGHGQLIFATHDSNLLSAKCLRRDEVWFVEKDRQEASDLYSLVEFKDADGVKVRNDRSFEKDYIKGRYGAIPYVNYNW